jgi:hypothetical protein
MKFAVLRVIGLPLVAAATLLLAACAIDPPQPAPEPAPAPAPAPAIAPVPPPARAPLPALGQSKATAIEVCGPPGQRAYLNQLVCTTGERPSYRRVGSFGARTAVPPLSGEDAAARLKRALSTRALKPGEVDEHIVDGYEVVCSDTTHMIYLDMYHCEQPAPTTAPPGFKLKSAREKIVSN